MLKELLTYLTTEASPLAKQSKLLQHSISLRERYLRHHKAWADHLAKCHAFLARKLREIEPSSVTILGSGHLIETPLCLFSNVQQIQLVDFVFPNEVKLAKQNDSRITLTECDLSGVLQSIANFKEFGRLPPVIAAPLPLPLAPNLEVKTDLVISANILSQLPIHPIALIQKMLFGKTDPFTNEQYFEFAENILRQHLDLLKQQKRSLLITDFERIQTRVQQSGPPDLKLNEVDSAGEELRGTDLNSETTILNIELPGVEETWTWNLETKSRFTATDSSSLRVAACDFGISQNTSK